MSCAIVVVEGSSAFASMLNCSDSQPRSPGHLILDVTVVRHSVSATNDVNEIRAVEQTSSEWQRGGTGTRAIVDTTTLKTSAPWPIFNLCRFDRRHLER